MKKYFFLILLIIIVIGLPYIFNFSSFIEGYSNFKISETIGDYPNAQNSILIQDIYPPINKNELSDDVSNDIWKYYPIFKLGSYEQITNNIKYPSNPDIGKCTPASMCGALYHDKNLGSNIINPLPPVSNTGTRIGYFTSLV